MSPAFALWITGRPAAGKSVLAAALVEALADRGVAVERLESDALRPVLTPDAGFSEAGRDVFYAALLQHAHGYLDRGVPVVFDATANRRRYRDAARATIPRFLEVFVDTPAAVCEARDPKGLYHRARTGLAPDMPGAGADYEPPTHPEVVLDGRERPEDAAERLIDALAARGWLRTAPGPRC